SRTTAPGASWRAWDSTPTWSSASPGWSTRPSTSGARPRPGCGGRPRRSARIAACRSPPATGADGRGGRAGSVPAAPGLGGGVRGPPNPVAPWHPQAAMLSAVSTLPPAPGADIPAVLFDLSGVATTSPWPARAAGGGGDLELLVGPYHEDTDHPWHRLERGEITLEEWLTAIQAHAAEVGGTLDLTPLQSLLGSLTVHDNVTAHVAALRAEGYRTALVTNNVREGAAAWRALIAVDDLFDVVVD